MSKQTSELRCCCHRLLALVDHERQRVVLRCPRCKREAVLVLREAPPGAPALQVSLCPADR